MIKPDYILRSYRRTLCISVNKKGEVIVRAPKRLSIEHINKFLLEKEGWIKLKKQQMEIINQQNKSINNYERILLMGVEYSREDIDGLKKIEWDTTNKKIYLPLGITKAEFIKKISNFYIKHAKDIVIERVSYFSRLMSLSFNSISLMNNKTRWGTCSKKGDLKFNWRLAMLKPNTIDYLVVHELAHLIEFNHSKKFYKIIECIMPKYKSINKDLKKYGYLLELFR